MTFRKGGSSVRFTTMPPTAAAAAGAVCISSSAVLMRLAGTSASLTALGRCVFALPVLGGLAWIERRPSRRQGAAPVPSRRRWLARLAGVILAADLIVWDHAIGAIGAGLGTVVGNLEVLIISLLAWLILGERPRRSLVLASPVMLAGLVLVGGLVDGAGSRAYGADPGLGVAYGAGVALLYAIYILMLRQATSSPGSSSGSSSGPSSGPPAGPLTGGAPRAAVAAPLFEATVGATAGSVVLGLAVGDFQHGLGPSAWAALGWLALLALTSQVIGWLLITVSMPRLAAGMIGALLLIQPAGSVALSYLFLGEHPSELQLAGVVLMLAGVVIAVSGRAPAVPYTRRRIRIIRHAPAASTGSVPKSP
jgi:drug/metabolite transporter (DMT)-like permease